MPFARWLCFAAVVALNGLLGAACHFGRGNEEAGPTGPSRTGDTASSSVEITSSLEKFEVLPRRVEWTVTTSLPPEQVREVRFGIDGRRVNWRDTDPAYVFGPEGTQLGTWVGPGRHRFVVRVFAADGSRTIETVTAQVLKTPTNMRAIQGGLWQAWGRLSESDLENPPPPKKLPSFTGALLINQRLLFVGPGRWKNNFTSDVSGL